jgi:hypothetical protein
LKTQHTHPPSPHKGGVMNFARLFFTAVLFVVVATTASAGVAGYTTARDSTGGNYVPITGSTFASWTITFVGIGADDGFSAVTPIGFSFTYDGVAYSQFRATANGCIILGPQGTAETFTNDIASVTHKPLLAPYWDDLATTNTNNVVYELTGTPGSRVLTVQWSNFVNSGGAGGPYNFQAKLFEADHHIEFVYGAMGAGTSYSLGLNDPLGGVNHYLSLQVANSNTFSSTVAANALTAAIGQDTRYSFSRPTPIATNVTVTPGVGTYPTVKAAMDSLRNNGVSASINVYVAGTTTEPTSVNDWDFIPGTHPGAGNNTVTVRLDPAVASATVTNNVAGDGIRLRGMRNLIIDGDDPTTGGIQRGLTISNVATGAAGRGITLLEGTQGAVIKNCILTTNALSGAAASFGVVAILTANLSTATTTRGVFGSNDGNIIENNDIREGATNRPTNCILMSGTTTAGLRNTGNIIRQNEIRNYGGSTATRGIRIEANDSMTVIQQNKIYTISTTIADVRAIMLNTTTVFGTQIIRNEIYDQLSTSVSATIQGIRIVSATVTGNTPRVLVANNFIYINAPGGLTTGTVGGIDQAAGDVDIVFNSIRIGGNLTAGTTGTTAGYRRTAAGTVNLFSNILYNAATNSGGTAVHWGIASSGNAGLNSNHNDIFVDGVGGVFGTTTGVVAGNVATLADWRVATNQDINSVSVLPPFTSATDLHIPNSTNTSLESGGVSASGVTTDIDGDTRATYNANPLAGPNSAPDIGADEFNGLLTDVTPPNIAYTALLNTPLTSNRTISARIRDAASGVQRSTAGAPRLWFKKNSGSYVQVTGVEATGDTFNFTLDYSLVGGVVAGDTISYYVAAQDSGGAVGTVPAGTSGTINPPNATVANPNSYRILLTLTGTYSIGSGQQFANLGEFFAFVNGNAVGGNLTANITSDISETASAALNSVFYVGGPWTIHIRPSGGSWTDTASVAGPMIDLNGVRNVIIGESTTSSGLNSLTLRNISTSTLASTIRFINDASNNLVTNCVIEGAGTSTTAAGTIFFSTGVSTGNVNNTISNNDIRDRSTTGARHAVAIISVGSASAPNGNNTITNNNIYNFTSSGVTVSATGNAGGWTISGNSFFYNNATAPTTAQTVINVSPGIASTGSNWIYGNYIGGQQPMAGGAAWTNTGAITWFGINATVSTSSWSTIRNNVVKNIALTSTGAANFVGIGLANGKAIVDSNMVGDPAVAARSVVGTGVPTPPSTYSEDAMRRTTNLKGQLVEIMPSYLVVEADVLGSQSASGGSPSLRLEEVPNSISAAGTGSVTGIQVGGAVVDTAVVADNEISNMTSTGTATTTVVRGILQAGTATSVVSIRSNYVHDLRSGGTNAVASSGAPAHGIVWFPASFTPGGDVTGNTVHGIYATNTGAEANNAFGILASNCSAVLMGNLVYDVRNASTGVTVTTPPVAAGLALRATSSAVVANNMISVGDSTGVQFNGIWNAFGTNNSFALLYNSILVGGVASGSIPTFGLLRGINTGAAITTTITARNNIIVNQRSGGTGKHYALANQMTTLDTTGWGPNRFDYNIFNTVDPSTMGLWGPTDRSLSEWQGSTSGDANSFLGDPGFVSSTDLHINPLIGLASNNGQPLVGIVDIDFDGDARSTTTPDRGADEYVYTPPPSPALTVTPELLNYGSVEVNQSRALSVLVRNIGLGVANIDTITITNPNYVAVPDSFVLAFNDTQRVTITFTAPSPGATNENGTLSFVSNDTTAPTVSLIARSGVAHPAVSPTSFSFTLFPSPDTTTAMMTVRNAGTDTLNYLIDKIFVSGLPRMGDARQESPKQFEPYTLPKGAVDQSGPITPPGLLGRGGPDAYGYFWLDSNEPGGPTFNWVDITSSAPFLDSASAWTPTGTGSNRFGDEGYYPVVLPFSFNYYGIMYDTLFIGTNGYCSFNRPVADNFTNNPYPTPGGTLDNHLGVFWDDLEVRAGARVYYGTSGGNYVVTFQNMARFAGTVPNYTFQIILKPRGSWLYQYLAMGINGGVLNSASVGMENANGTIGLTVVHNAAYIQNNLAILITNDLLPWLSLSSAQGVLSPGDSNLVEVRVHPAGLSAGNYSAKLAVRGNAPDTAIATVDLTVLQAPAPVVSNLARATRVPVGGDTLVVTANIQDTVGITSAFLRYSVNGGAASSVLMTRTSGTPENGTYRGVIPGGANANGNRIQYQVQANSGSGMSTTTALAAANSYYAGLSPMSITGLRRVHPDGRIIDSLYYVRVTGTVNGPNFQTTNLGYHFQDAVGGVQLFSFGITRPPLSFGDSIVVIGRLMQFRGLTEIVPDDQTADVQVVATGRPVPIIDLSVEQFRANPELYESRVVRFTHLHRRDATPPWPSAGGSANIIMYQTTTTDTIIARIDSDTEIPGSPEPLYPVRMTGVISQFSTATSVYNNGYQTQPRYLTDLSRPLPLTAVFDSTTARINLSWSTPPSLRSIYETPTLSEARSSEEVVSAEIRGTNGIVAGIAAAKAGAVSEESEVIQPVAATKDLSQFLGRFAVAEATGSDRKISSRIESVNVAEAEGFLFDPARVTDLTKELLESAAVVRYSIYRSVAGGAFALHDTVSGGTNSYQDTRVEARSYRYLMTALLDNGLLVPSDTVSVTAPFIRAEVEPNNTAGTANYMTIGYGVVAALGTADADWFRFPAPIGHLVVDGTNAGNTTDVELFLYDSTGTTLLYLVDRNTNDRLEFNLPYSGVYYVRVIGYQGATGPYTLYARIDTPTDPREPDDGPLFGFPMIATHMTVVPYRDTVATINPGVGLPGFDIDYRWRLVTPGNTIIATLKTRSTFPGSTLNGGYIGIGRKGAGTSVYPDVFGGVPLAQGRNTTGGDITISYNVTTADTYYVYVSVHLQSPSFGLDQAGPNARYDVQVDVVTGVDEGEGIPMVFALDQNYPNPFNPVTQIRYALPKESFVTLRVYNALGQEIATLANEQQAAGYVTTTWNGRNNLGHAVGSGVYFYRIDARPIDGSDAFAQVKKMILMK